MIEYRARTAGVMLRGDSLLYVLTRAGQEGLKIESHGTIHLSDLNEEANRLKGAKIICGINYTQYCSKAVKSISGGITADPDTLMWELSRSCTEDLNNYYFSFLNLLSSDNSLDETAAFAVKRRSIERLGNLFEEHGLVLHSLVFEPEAIRQMARDIIVAPRVLVMLVEPDHVHLQLHARKRLLRAQSLHPVEVYSVSGCKKLVEEIGTIILSTPAAQTVSRKIQVLATGDALDSRLLQTMTQTLPYDLEIREISPTDYGLNGDNPFLQEFGRYYLPYSLAYLYNRESECESSPVKNGVWS